MSPIFARLAVSLMLGAVILPVPELAHQMGVIPILWLALLRLGGRPVGYEMWWVAGALAVSWVADSISHSIGVLPISALYPVTQAAIIGLVIVGAQEVPVLLAGLGAIGLAAIVLQGQVAGWQSTVGETDALLHTAAWLLIVALVWPLSAAPKLRLALLVYFGLGWLAWTGYTLDPWGLSWAPQQLVALADRAGFVLAPMWITWSVYQLARLTGIALFCYAAWSKDQPLKILRRAISR